MTFRAAKTTKGKTEPVNTKVKIMLPLPKRFHHLTAPRPRACAS